jgi:hypothetical protein
MRDRMAPIGAQTPLDRSTQLLPIPLGGLTPVRRRPSSLARFWWHHRAAVSMVLALASTGAGVWLSVSPRVPSVGEDAGGVHIESITLTAVTPQSIAGMRVFTGDASLAISVEKLGLVQAGAVMTWGGAPATGRCVLRTAAARTTEACAFVIGTTRLSAVDSYDTRARTWHRQYHDGVDIAISVPAGEDPIPVPFPLGR